MRPSAPAFFLLAALTLAPSALAAETMYANDPARELKEDVEDVFGLYILNPSRRHPKEKVEISGDTATLWLYHDPRKQENDRIKCDALTSILLGRFQKGGAQPFFAQFTRMNAVEVAYFDLKSSRILERDGDYVVTQTPSTVLKVRLSRKRAAQLKWDEVRTALVGEEKPDKNGKKAAGVSAAECVRAGEKYVDSKFYNTRDYFR